MSTIVDSEGSEERVIAEYERGPITVRVEQLGHGAEPIDLDAWLKRYVRMVLELEGYPADRPPRE